MKVKIKVIAPSGAYLPKYGERPRGGEFEVTQDEARELTTSLPDTYELVSPEKPKREKPANGE